MKYVIGIDLGTSGVKALLMDEGGAVVGQSSAAYSPDYPKRGWSEQDPAVWWEGTKTVVKSLLKETGINAADVAGAACSGQMHGSVFLDKNGESVRKAILWNDTRTTKQTRDIYNLVGGEGELLKHAQNRALEGFTLPKILWVKENEPDAFARVDKVVLPKDYINYKLTGNVKTEKSDAAGTLLYNVKESRWSDEVVKAVGLSSDILPEVVESVGLVGEVSAEAARELGLSVSTKVLGGGADNSCAAIGNGIVKEGQAVVSVGTSGTVVAFLSGINAEVTGDVHLFSYSYPESYYAMGVMLSAGECRNWAQKALHNGKSFEEMDKLAANAPAGSGGVIFLPYLFGERCPYSDADARGVLFGLSGNTTEGDVVRAVLEGAAFGFRDIFRLVSDFADMNDIYITGGGSRSALFGEIIASVINRPLNVLKVEQGPAFGAAIIAGVGAGVFRDFDEAVKKTIETDRTIQPNKEWAEKYDKIYAVYRGLYAANKAAFKEISAIN